MSGLHKPVVDESTLVSQDLTDKYARECLHKLVQIVVRGRVVRGAGSGTLSAVEQWTRKSWFFRLGEFPSVRETVDAQIDASDQGLHSKFVLDLTLRSDGDGSVLLERWTFENRAPRMPSQLHSPSAEQLRKQQARMGLEMGLVLRQVYCLSRLLPAHSVYQRLLRSSSPKAGAVSFCFASESSAQLLCLNVEQQVAHWGDQSPASFLFDPIPVTRGGQLFVGVHYRPRCDFPTGRLAVARTPPLRPRSTPALERSSPLWGALCRSGCSGASSTTASSAAMSPPSPQIVPYSPRLAGTMEPISLPPASPIVATNPRPVTEGPFAALSRSALGSPANLHSFAQRFHNPRPPDLFLHRKVALSDILAQLRVLEGKAPIYADLARTALDPTMDSDDDDDN